jgi:hypothetical protein
MVSARTELDQLSEGEAEEMQAPSVQLADMFDDFECQLLASAGDARRAPRVNQFQEGAECPCLFRPAAFVHRSA